MDILSTYLSPTRQGQPAGPRGKADTTAQSYSASLSRLLIIFVQWKLVLFIVICASPLADYDTSTALLFGQSAGSASPTGWIATLTNHIAVKLTRWDAIYFTSSSERGHLYEQEWAFSWAVSKTTSLIATVLPLPSSLPPIVRHAIAGVLLSNTAHFLSVIALYCFIYEVVPSLAPIKLTLASNAALFHILSPAGVFLCAPYGESSFAALNFIGLLAYVWALQARYSTIPDAAMIDAFWTVISGLCFALSALVRSNALFSGLIFLLDLVQYLPRLPQSLTSPPDLIRIASIVLAGSLIAVGFTLPQYVAYREFCGSSNGRPWCYDIPPSIYTFVQREYWNVGFLRYWTMSNLPLFLLAAPMLILLINTSISALFESDAILDSIAWKDTRPSTGQRQAETARRIFVATITRLAVPQLLLAVLAFFSFHVQIINRISSGYPLWYFLLAVALHQSTTNRLIVGSRWSILGDAGRRSLSWIIRTMIVYSLIQAGLYANFLPPA